MSIIQQINELMETNQSLKEENSKFTDTLDEKDEAIQKLTETIERQKKWEKKYIKSKKEEIQKLSVAPAKKDEAIKYQKETINALTKENQNLNHKLAQKSNQLDLCDGKLSQDMNGLRSKLAMYKNRNKDLKEQIDQTKVNALVAKDNEIALLKQKLSELESQQGKAQEKAKTSLQAIFNEFMISVNQSGYVKHKVMIGRYQNTKPKYKTFYMAKEVAKHLDDYPQVGKEMARVSNLVDTM